MTVLLILVALGATAAFVYAVGVSRRPGGGAGGAAFQPGSRSPRFSGRRIESPPPRASGQASRSKRRLRNGRRVSAVRNGRAVTLDHAIGLGCLAPISECTLGDNCICREEARAGREVHL